MTQEMIDKAVQNTDDVLFETITETINFDMGEWLNEDVLEIKREQTLVSGTWTTSRYTLVLGTGGPHIEINTDGILSGYWGGNYAERGTQYREVEELMEEVFEFLNEIYEQDSVVR